MKNAIQFLGMLLLGCSVDPCLSNQRTDDLGFCVVAAAAGSGGSGGMVLPGSGGAGDAGEAGSASACVDPSELGDTCTSAADCHCDVNYCGIQPGETSGACTRTGCVEDPSVCPEDWSCMDLKVFNPSLPSICVPPQ